MSYNTTPYSNTPLTLMLYLAKRMRVFYYPEVHVVYIYIPMICKSGFIGKQYPTHEVMSLMQNPMTIFQTKFESHCRQVLDVERCGMDGTDADEECTARLCD